ncbi:5141_t:CDS:2 [Dentiscutata heterogama]|uniref:5141_t:CDS:1 n=1 Tax=Dentiscutata heterogama TaxID=1316150 RepID=A0ACA9K414_9GLOM|nr:5141_t:CDS:2 [Dentiscutata heterogama]
MATALKISISQTMEEERIDDAVCLSLTELKEVNHILFSEDNIINTRIQSPTAAQTELSQSLQLSPAKSIKALPIKSVETSQPSNNKLPSAPARSVLLNTPHSVLLSTPIKYSVVRKSSKSRHRTSRYNSIDSGVGSSVRIMNTSNTQNSNISRLILNTQHKFSPKISSPLRHEILLDLSSDSSSESSKDDSCLPISRTTSPWRDMCEALLNSPNKGKSRELIEGQDSNVNLFPSEKDQHASTISTILSTSHPECTVPNQDESPKSCVIFESFENSKPHVSDVNIPEDIDITCETIKNSLEDTLRQDKHVTLNMFNVTSEDITYSQDEQIKLNTDSNSVELMAKKRVRKQHTRNHELSSPIRFSKRLAKKVKKNPNPCYKY